MTWLAGTAIIAAAQVNLNKQPKLVVGIMVDQMRYDYLFRYKSHYGKGGFNRLLGEGFSCENTQYDYVPTFTAPGHACVYTGATPAVNGIIANEWYDPEQKKHRYVTTDPRYKTVGASGKVGQHSPTVMLSSTVTDELRLATNFKSKVVGVCLKDRGSILPAGHIPDASYWFDDATGNWITSSYYPDSLGLPGWVNTFNARKLPEQYCNQVWDKLPGVNYEESFENWSGIYDQARYAVSLSGGFPHNLAALRKKMGLGVLRYTPYGNTLTLDFALEAIQKMNLGADEITDFLCLSFSATDYAGHQFGVHAMETEDIYLRLDNDLSNLLTFLDQKFGKDNVLVFLTADHGGAETPAHLRKIGIPAGVFPESQIDSLLQIELNSVFDIKADIIEEISNQQIWFNTARLDSLELPVDAVSVVAAEWLKKQKGIYDVYTRNELQLLPYDHPFAPMLRRGIHPRRSGHVIFQLDPAWHPDDQLFGKGGTTHGSSYAYDRHVPLIWYGNGIKPGFTHRQVSVCDIAPTVSAMLRIMEPNGNMGRTIEEVFR